MASVNELRDELRRLVGLPAAGASRLNPVTPFSREVAETETPAAVLAELLSVAGPSASDAASAELAALRQQLGAVRESVDRQREALEASSRAIAESAASSRGGVDWLGSLRDFATGVRGNSGGGFSLAASPLVSLLGRLFFRRDSQAAPEPFAPFSLPDPVRLDAALSTGREGLAGVDYAATGAPRRVERASGPAAPITIQVQTMDSRSFLDNSDQIARAVREAMLNSHSINDIVGEM